MRRLFFVIGGAMLAFAMTVSVAQAQTTTVYNGPTTPTTAGATQGSGGTPTLSSAGSSFLAEECGFLANGTASLGLNSAAAGTDNVEADGCARQTVSLVRNGTAMSLRSIFAVTGLQLAQSSAPVVAIEGRQYTAKLGANAITATGIGSNGATRLFVFNFNITNSSGGSGLVRTGVKILGTTLVGLALVAVGFFLVGVTRRRRGEHTA